MTLTGIRKKMCSRDHIEKAINRDNFQRDLDLSDPYAKLAAAIILQALIDSIDHPSHAMRIDPDFIDTLLDGIGLNASFDNLRENILIRAYLHGEGLPKIVTDWSDTRGRRND